MLDGLTLNESLRRPRRKAEKRYRKTGLAVHKENYIKLRKQTTNLAHEKKCDYNRDKLNNANNKILYSTIKQLLDKKQDAVLPDSQSDADVANLFLNYFIEKIEKISSSSHDNRQILTYQLM